MGVQDVITHEEGNRAYAVSMKSMSRLNRNGARLMHKYRAHAATDVTGFGLIGHAQNLASNQQELCSFRIHTLPVIRNMLPVNNIVDFKLRTGYSAETSGGLLVLLESLEVAQQFIEELKQLHREEGDEEEWGWIIGDVVPAIDQQRTAFLDEQLQIIEV
eukprot:TRINITY_DN10723_c0_g2_i2.p1 TRINITY_DN10723_c0_g2~~TRINITY_DN10723_c0_g2_i2.p1  ORF type:complete len:170 (+),score=62.24 TRINITY_DN10723_c0_g2_i2:33-512(+)